MAGRAVFQIKLCAWGSVHLGLIHALLFAQSAGSVPGLQPPGTGWGLAVLPRSDGALSSPTRALLSLPVHGVHSREAGAVRIVIQCLGLAVCSGHVTRLLCFFGYHEFSLVCLLSQSLIFFLIRSGPIILFPVMFP